MIIKAGYELHNYPLYLNQNAECFDWDHVDIFDHDIIDHLIDTSTKFSLISLSNIADNFDPKDLDYFFNLLRRRTKINGRVIIRRRNTDYPLYQYMKKYFLILNHHLKNITDRTYLYQELIIGTPRR